MSLIQQIIYEALDTYAGSQHDLAAALGVSHSTVSRWLAHEGKANPSEGSCLRLARITGRSAREIFVAAGHDPNLLPPDPEGETTPEVEVIRARTMRRLERERLLDEMPEPTREAAETVLLEVARSFRKLAAAEEAH